MCNTAGALPGKSPDHLPAGKLYHMEHKSTSEEIPAKKAASLDSPPPMLYNGIEPKAPAFVVYKSKCPRVGGSTREHFLSARTEVNRKHETCNSYQGHEKIKARQDYHLPPCVIQRERFRANRPTIFQQGNYSIRIYRIQVYKCN